MNVKKAIMVIERTIVTKLVFLNTNLYMKIYSNYLRKIGINIKGKPRYINNDVYFDGNDYSKITLGRNITISREVMFLTHDYSLTTGMFSLGNSLDIEKKELYHSKEIKIGDDCFIGARVSILPGSIIGNNVIVGACSVVKGVIPDNCVVVGNPCKVIASTQEWTNRNLSKKKFLTEYK